MEVINLKEKAGRINKLYEYQIISRMNNHTFTLVKAEDRTLDFHTHPDSDEVFFIVQGKMKLEFRSKIVELHEGEMIVVPRGVEHRPVCESPVTCMLIEREGTLTPDNTGGTYKA
jgi:mannose-6-phosphate isomerase-like protein (cupin superfamily)